MPDNATELLDRPADKISDSQPAVGADTSSAEAASAGQPADVIAADLLVEEISIDGMCGVY
jgi:mycofactocin precursor